MVVVQSFGLGLDSVSIHSISLSEKEIGFETVFDFM